MEMDRLLPMQGAFNMRDLGGYKAAGGKHTKWRTLLRSDELYELTAADLDYLATLPLRTDIDFRGESEQVSAPDKLPAGVNRYPLYIDAANVSSFLDGGTNNFTSKMELIYAHIIRHFQPAYQEFFRILAQEQSAPLLFHCTAGKDRTGIAAALLLSALGVDRTTIMADYLLSAQYLQQKYGAIARAYPELAPALSVQKEFLKAAFRTIDEEFGGMDHYLTHYLQADIELLRTLYTE